MKDTDVNRFLNKMLCDQILLFCPCGSDIF